MEHIFLIKGTHSWKWVTAKGATEDEAEINALIEFNKANDTAIDIYGRSDFKCIT